MDRERVEALRRGFLRAEALLQFAACLREAFISEFRLWTIPLLAEETRLESPIATPISTPSASANRTAASESAW